MAKFNFFLRKKHLWLLSAALQKEPQLEAYKLKKRQGRLLDEV